MALDSEQNLSTIEYMELKLSFNPSSTEDIREAIQALERLLPQGVAPPELAHVIGAVANKKYGNGRLGYLAAVARASDSGALVSALMNDHFGGSFQSYGGTHASIEKTWRTRGGTAWAEKLIDDTPDGERQVMFPAARELVLMCVGLQHLSAKLDRRGRRVATHLVPTDSSLGDIAVKTRPCMRAVS